MLIAFIIQIIQITFVKLNYWIIENIHEYTNTTHTLARAHVRTHALTYSRKHTHTQTNVFDL